MLGGGDELVVERLQGLAQGGEGLAGDGDVWRESEGKKHTQFVFAVLRENEGVAGGGGSGGVRPKLDGAVGDLALLKKELHVPDTAEFPTKKSI